jgi:hypothetical protein
MKYYKDPVKHFAYTRWHKINNRTVNGHNPDIKSRGSLSYILRGIEVRFNRKEFNAWCELNRIRILRLMTEGEIPSIDRIDSHGHYELTNMRIISMTKNQQLGLIERNRLRTEQLSKQYPPKQCLACGKTFTRKKRTNGLMECFRHYKERKTCGVYCAVLLHQRDKNGQFF